MHLESTIAKVAWRAVTWLGGRVRAARRSEDLRWTSKPLLPPGVAARLIADLSDEQITQLAGYLASSEFEAVAHQMSLAYIQINGDRPSEELRSAVREEMLHGLRHYGIIDQIGIIDVVASALEMGCVEAWGTSTAKELPDKAAIPSTATLVASAARNSELLRSLESLVTVSELSAKLRSQVAAIHDRMRLPHMDTSRTVLWNDLYVQPHLSLRAEKDISLDASNLVVPGQRYVILGDPGAGKSTLATKLAYDIATSETDKRVPFLVILRDLSGEIAKGGQPLTDYLAMASAAPYNVRFAPELVEYLLHNNRAVVILDGLDELTDHSLRGQLALLIEGFAKMYPLVSIVVTSRRVGYDQATSLLPPRPRAMLPGSAHPAPSSPVVGLEFEWPPDEIVGPAQEGVLAGTRTSPPRRTKPLAEEAVALDSRTFPVVAIIDFDSDQVASYAAKWFALEDAVPVGERERMCRSFLRESQSIADLRSNPLLLSLLCTTYASEQYLPRNRAQIYEKCALMLFEGWDRRRGIRLMREFDGHIRGAVRFLAWQMLTGGGQTELPRHRVVRDITSYLVKRRFDEVAAEGIAEGFLEFCAGRAWVLAEVGATETELIYGFAHRTFLEYFAAEHLVRSFTSVEKIWQTLRPNVVTGQWEMVGQLTLQLLDRNYDDGADQLLNLVLDDATGPQPSSATAVLLADFTALATAHVSPSPDTLRRIAELAIACMLTVGPGGRAQFRVNNDIARAVATADNAMHQIIHSALMGNGEFLRSAVRDLFSGYMNPQELALWSILPQALSRAGLDDIDSHRTAEWRELGRELQHLASARGMPRAWPSAEDLAGLEKAEFDRLLLLEQTGVSGLYQHRLALREYQPPLAIAILQLDYLSRHGFQVANRVRDTIMRAPTPWVPASFDSGIVSLDTREIERQILVPEEIMTTAVMLLPYLEAAAMVISLGPDSAYTMGGIAGGLVMARAAPVASQRKALVQAIKSDLVSRKVPSSMTNWLLNWANHQFSVIGHPRE